MYDLKDSDLFELDENDFDTVLATDIVFTGTINFTKPFMIKGSVNGTINSTGDLVIDDQAVVKADISADRVIVKGSVEGNIKGKKLVFISSTGSVKGDIETGEIVLEPGSSFYGKCAMKKQA